MTRGDRAVKARGQSGQEHGPGGKGATGNQIHIRMPPTHQPCVCPCGGQSRVRTQLPRPYSGAEEAALVGLCEDPVRLGMRCASVRPCPRTESSQ